MKKAKILIAVIAGIILLFAGFQFLILEQDNILKRYFILEPQERMKSYNQALANSLSKYFIRENKSSDLEQVSDYIKKYGSTQLFKLIFVFKDKDNTLKQVTNAGIANMTIQALSGDRVYPATIDNGRIDGYLMIALKEVTTFEFREGLFKYKAITYSLRFLYFMLMIALSALVLYHNYSSKMKLARDMAEIKASNDGLTGLHTHEYFQRILEIEVERCRIYNTPVALMMLDVDHFKQINDTYGHLAGDVVLQEVAKVIKANTRATDILARYGGEEFSVIIPYVARIGEVPDQKKRLKSFIEEIKNVSERIRQSVAASKIEFLSQNISVTISIGAAFYYKRTMQASATALVHRADTVLYKAKHLGRNKVFIDYESMGPIENRLKS